MNNEQNNNFTPPQPTPEVKRCPVCGKELPAQAAFCGECGYNFATGSSPYTVPPQTAVVTEDTAPLTTGEYLILFLLTLVPVVNIILYLIWSFSSGVNVNRRNFCRAYLILSVIGLVLYFILIFAMAGLMMAGMEMVDASFFGAVLPFIFH